VRERATDRDVKTADGRLLAVSTYGALDGHPVFLMHGTPGSRNGPRPRGIVLYRLGVRLICYDRPGYGGSDRHHGRSVADAAADVAAIADDLGIERFAVVGRSGGGPHALACAATLPERVTRASVLVGLAPANASGLDWYDGMTESNVKEYTTADDDPGALQAELTMRADWARRDPESLVQWISKELTEPDLRVVGDFAIRRLLADTYAEALRPGAAGWIDDALALRSDWGFDLAAISVPVWLWHGADDTFSPVSHTLWLAARIAGAQVEVQRDAAHFGAVEVLPRILAWLTAPAAAASDPHPGPPHRIATS
jgi:pimeloyl-ACP methyl ester carboxylesterase